MNDTRLRLVYLLPSLGGGGAERSVLDFLHGHDHSRFELHLVLHECRGPLLALLPADVTVHDLERRGRGSFAALVWRTRRLLRTLSPNIVISHLWYASAVHLLAKRFVPPGRCLHLCVAHEQVQNIRNERLGNIKLALMRQLYPLADGCMGVSDSVTGELSAFFCVAPDRTWNQPNPIRIDRKPDGSVRELWPPGRTRLLAIGRLAREKGFDIALDALARVRHKDWHLVIVGEGPLRETLMNQAQVLGLAERVTFFAFTPYPGGLLEAADLTIVPSRCEGGPRVVIESLCLGTPVIACDAGAYGRELLDHPGAGVVVAVGDCVALGRAIEHALENGWPQPIAREIFVERYDPARVVADFEQRIRALHDKKVHA